MPTRQIAQSVAEMAQRIFVARASGVGVGRDRDLAERIGPLPCPGTLIYPAWDCEGVAGRATQAQFIQCGANLSVVG